MLKHKLRMYTNCMRIDIIVALKDKQLLIVISPQFTRAFLDMPGKVDTVGLSLTRDNPDVLKNVLWRLYKVKTDVDSVV